VGRVAECLAELHGSGAEAIGQCTEERARQAFRIECAA
jgi:hypothetical protein